MSTKVRDAMAKDDFPVVAADDLVDLAAQMLLWSGARHLPVVEPSSGSTVTRRGKVVGVLCERDILRHQGQRGRASATRVAEVMSAPAITVGPEEPLVSATSLMLNRRVGCLPVVSEGNLVGLLVTTDLLRMELEEEGRKESLAHAPAVRSFMKSPPVAIARGTELFEAASLMADRHVRHLPVLEGETIVGIISDRDIRAVVGDPRRFLADEQARERLGHIPVDQIMSRSVVTVGVDAPVTSVFDGLLKRRVGALPVVDGAGHLVGIVSYLDALEALR